ncbi:unnamed protein product, partial [Prorocentrum cordatum]
AATLNAVNHAEQLLQTVSVQLQQLPRGLEDLGQMRGALNRVYEQVSIPQAHSNSSAEARQQVGEGVVNLAAQVTNLEGQVNQVGQMVMTIAMQVGGLCQ